MQSFERTAKIARNEGDPSGAVRGVLVTDGEASDGHILNIGGAELPASPPLLFGHDDFSGRSNLGSWTSLQAHQAKSGELGSSFIEGRAQIDLGGPDGSDKDWRSNIAYMVDQGHIEAFSVRWQEVGEPQRRVNLPSDHPAAVDEKKAKGAQRWGLYFEKWRMLEGSVVTLGADPAAVIHQMAQATGEARVRWRAAFDDMLKRGDLPRDLEELVTEFHTIRNALVQRGIQDFGSLLMTKLSPGELIGIDLGINGTAVIPRAAYDAMLRDANERLNYALDVQEQIAADAAQAAHDSSDLPEREPTGRTEDAVLPDGEQEEVRESPPLDVERFVDRVQQMLDGSDEAILSAVQDRLDRAMGKVT